MRVTVLLGGASDERDVSLATGAQMASALREAGHDVCAFDTVRGRVLEPAEEDELRDRGVEPDPPSGPWRDLIASGHLSSLTEDPEAGRADVFALALHGGAGEDGTVQGVLESAGLAFTGSDRIGCLLAMDKDVSKRLMRDAGIDTPGWATDVFDADQLVRDVGLPMVVKAANGGSSLRLERAADRTELDAALAAARDFEDRVVAEAWVTGREFTVGIVAGEALPVGEIVPEHDFFDYACKYQPGLAQEIFPADVDAAAAHRMQELALEVHGILRLRDYSRVDFMMDAAGRIWCLEANNLPGMTANSLLPRAARAAGIEFPELCDRLVRLAVERRNPVLANGV